MESIELHTENGLRYRIDRDERRGMRTGVVVYANHKLLEQIRRDLSLQ